jgi:hypothetical protein
MVKDKCSGKLRERTMVKKAPMNIKEIRLYNMIDMGFRYSGMIRLYEKGSKQKLIVKKFEVLPEISNAESSAVFDKIHSDYCIWATENIFLAEKRKGGVVVKKSSNVSYGQAAKTLDVTLKVLVYYCRWPNYKASKRLNKFIHAAIDNKMIKHLKRNYKTAFKKWPKSVAEIDRQGYIKLQNLVKRFISERDTEITLPVQFDDKYWYLLKEGLPTKR